MSAVQAPGFVLTIRGSQGMVACDAWHTACGVFWLMAYSDEALFKLATSSFFQTHLLYGHSCALLQLRHLLVQFLQQHLADSLVLCG